MNLLETKELSKAYDGMFKVSNLELKISEGQVYGFLGPNGAGKSTTMKMILGLVRPTKGRIKIFGKEFNEENRIEILSHIGSLIESPSYYGHLTGAENMEIMKKLLDVPKKNIDKVIEIVRMEKQLNKKVKNYSLGMKQRLGIAMALVKFPKLLVLDEPTNGLDPAGIEEVRKLIKELPSKYGITVMLSSHLLGEIEQMVTSLGIINHGELIFQDDMCSLEKSREPYILIRTENNKKAMEHISEYSPEYANEYLKFRNLNDQEVGRIVYKLNEDRISIYRVEEHQKSLEEVFLNLTGKEMTL